jgi:hypothetical protein
MGRRYWSESRLSGKRSGGYAGGGWGWRLRTRKRERAHAGGGDRRKQGCGEMCRDDETRLGKSCLRRGRWMVVVVVCVSGVRSLQAVVI